MRTSLLALLALAWVTTPAAAQTPTADELVRRMDEVMTFEHRVADATLSVFSSGGGAPEVRTLKLWSRGWSDTYAEFLSPPRDQGTKYLKLEKNLYMYLPRTEKVVKISGHLLRQSLMDSDFSYEDMLETRALLSDYDAKVVGEEKVDGVDCFVVDLTAKQPGLTYHRRKTWIAKDTFVPVRAERFAQTGVLLKVLTMRDVVSVGAKRYPTLMIMEDKLRQGSRTEMRLQNLDFATPIPEARFSRRQLMKE